MTGSSNNLGGLDQKHYYGETLLTGKGFIPAISRMAIGAGTLPSKLHWLCTIIAPNRFERDQSQDVQFKEFSLTKQKTRPRTDYEWIGKTI